MDSNQLKLYFFTLKNVKLTQLYHQFLYRFSSNFINPILNSKFNSPSFINLKEGVLNHQRLTKSKYFEFLNLEKTFDVIDWNFNEYGKLWTYNLNYFDFLHQENISKEEGLKLIQLFCDFKDKHKDAYEPYPISLRGINWVKFLSKHKINDFDINQQLYNDFLRLESKIEYHILANHLIENAFSLLFGAYYFKNEKLYNKANNLLIVELEEQILEDGAHYELSPMYHCIMLHRILDCYNLVSNNDWKDNELAKLLSNKASLMLGWLEEILIDGKMPMLNDSTTDIAPTPASLFEYAENLNIAITPIVLKESGYRKLKTNKLEVLFDVGQIAPSYQPGHSHADSLQILLYSEGIPLIVDTGISTYEKNERRQLERSTVSHNTVTVNKLNSSQVWSGFRVAKRAFVKLIKDEHETIIASHNGYRNLSITCQREVQAFKDSFVIKDTIIGETHDALIQGHLHLHPDVIFNLEDNVLTLNSTVQLEFPQNTTIEIEDYFYCQGFNHLIPSKKLIYTFNKETTFTIKHL